MKSRYILHTALGGLTTHKSRSALTILGIVIGITAIILVVAIGANAEQVIVGELGGLGAETLVIRPGREPRGPTDFADVLLSDSLKERELEAILNPANVPDLRDAAPEVLVSGSVSYRGETFRPIILGFDAAFMARTLDLKLDEGRLFDEQDIRAHARVAIIGSRVRKELFGEEPPLRRSIDVKGQKFRVIGTFAPRGQVVFFNVDELVLIPHTAAQAFLTGAKHFNQIIARATSPKLVERTAADVKTTLRTLHRITDPENDDFNVQTQQGLVKQVSTIIGIFTTFLTFVVAIALLVGGIGIMNIMLVSVTERTREIGLRKALGATNRNILSQFLTEAILLTAAGGIAGVLLGAALAFGASVILSKTLDVPWAFSFPWTGAFLGFGVSALVGLVFGLYPARKAAKKDPIEALRYE